MTTLPLKTCIACKTLLPGSFAGFGGFAGRGLGENYQPFCALHQASVQPGHGLAPRPDFNDELPEFM